MRQVPSLDRHPKGMRISEGIASHTPVCGPISSL